MHPRSPYASGPPDFALLARLYPDKLGAHVKVASDGYASIDFRDPDASRALTETLLLHDFNVYAEPPPDRLCAAVPNRTNYVLWLQDLLANTWLPSRASVSEPCRAMAPLKASADSDPEMERPSKRVRLTKEADTVRALDVGTGATAIYPLIGCALDARWAFTGTDIDAVSLEHARKIIHDPRNVARHGLDQRVQFMLRAPTDGLLPVPEGSQGQKVERDLMYHVTMCNPPFYASQEEMQESAELKEDGPSAVCSGMPGEMITRGGEIAFVGLMIDESCQPERREKVIWYTSMVGKLSSIATLVDKLKGLEIDNYALTEFLQGRTRRWALAWSHTPYRLPDNLARPSTSSLSRYLPHSTLITRVFPFKQAQDPTSVLLALHDTLKSITDTHHFVTDAEAPHIWARFERDTWSRAARRARVLTERQDREAAKAGDEAGSKEPVLCIRCSAEWEEGSEMAAPALAFQPRRVQSSKASQIGESSTSAAEVAEESEAVKRVVRVSVQWTYGRDRTAFEACAKSLLQRMQLA